MGANYNKLWKILIDRNIRKEDLRVAAGITTTAMAKLGKNQPVHMEILLKICKVLDCQIEDVVEITEDVIDKAKKIKDANDDIKKIDDILNDSTSFHHKADNLYEELVKNLDYSKYIMAAKIAKGMAGKIPFILNIKSLSTMTFSKQSGKAVKIVLFPCVTTLTSARKERRVWHGMSSANLRRFRLLPNGTWEKEKLFLWGA